MKQKQIEFLRKAALCCAGYGLVSNAVLVPAFAAIMQEFPNANPSLTNFVRTGNFIISVPFALLTALLARYISKRKLLIISLIMFCFGGIGGAFADSMEFLAVTRALDAASDGMSTSLVCSLIAEIYQDEKTRSQVMGWQNGFSCALGILIGFPAGVLALYSWRYSFLLNAGSLFPLILAVFFVPETPPEGKKETMKNTKEKTSGKNLRIIVFNLVSFFVIQVCYAQLLYMLGSIVEELRLGSSVFSGSMTSVINITMTCTYVIFSPCYMKLKQLLPVLGFIATGVSMAVIAFNGNSVVFAIFVVIATLASALVYPYAPLVIARCATESMTSFWMAVYTVLLYTASAISSYIPGVIASLFGTITIAGSFLYTGGFLIIFAIVIIVFIKYFDPVTVVSE